MIPPNGIEELQIEFYIGKRANICCIKFQTDKLIFKQM